MSDFGKYLQHPANREAMSFDLREGGYDIRDHQAGPEAPERKQMARGRLGASPRDGPRRRSSSGSIEKPPSSRRRGRSAGGRRRAIPSPADPFAGRPAAENRFDPGQAAAHRRGAGHRHGQLPHATRARTGSWLLPGDDVKLTFPTVGQPPKAVSDNFTIVDFYESKMSEYDSNFVFVPIRKLQELRGMIDPTTGVGLVNAIQIKLKPGVDGDAVRDKLRAAFRREHVRRLHLARQARRPAGRRANGNTRSSTCCCS